MGLGRAKRGASRRIYLFLYMKALGLGKILSIIIGSDPLFIASETSKNSELSSSHMGSGNEIREVRVLVYLFLSPYIKALEIGKLSSFPPSPIKALRLGRAKRDASRRI